jgi:hypothetical protein
MGWQQFRLAFWVFSLEALSSGRTLCKLWSMVWTRKHKVHVS